MRISRKLPETGPQLVEVDPTNKMFTYFDVVARPLGQLQYKGRQDWVSDDGEQFREPAHALHHFLQRRGEQPTIEPGGELPVGAYTVVAGIEDITTTDDDILIRTPGGEIRIVLRKPALDLSQLTPELQAQLQAVMARELQKLVAQTRATARAVAPSASRPASPTRTEPKKKA